MVNQRLRRAFEWIARLVGLTLVGVGGWVAMSSVLYGIPLIAVGLLFVLRSTVAAELLDLAASVV
ncbi:hypothetical protein [Haloplanus halobius]|uniref:hypothetical protein n=1 Tax=Haloplanus halobius TaxID=2934938 RepID=UPI00200DF4D7|nr:hypothetical protein [Haloplanus sp. XH21]